MNNIDFDVRILDWDDNPILLNACPMCGTARTRDVRSLTLADVCSGALLNPPQGTVEREKKLDYAFLSRKISKATEPLEFPAEDIVTIKDAVKNLWGPLIVYRAMEVLDPSELSRDK